MSIENLEEISEKFVDREDSRWMDHDDCLVIYKFMNETIDILKSQSATIVAQEKRIKKLEQAQTYFPMTEDELLREKIGGTTD